ncbi:hypothetical protein Q3G72_024464 [Acer saccharum]|nr:hypothetical protein Q3G72_024464 [Acer saccharum]
MGGGATISMLASFEIVTKNTVFVLPEGALGSDVGGSYILSRLAGYFGTNSQISMAVHLIYSAYTDIIGFLAPTPSNNNGRPHDLE